MAEHISEQRLAEIREMASPTSVYVEIPADNFETASAIRDLLREINRLCEQLAAATARAEQAEARLAELREEWGVRWPDNQIEIADDEDDARTDAFNDAGLTLVRRETTKWRIDETPRCRSCGETSGLYGVPPLCSNCAVYAPPASATGGYVYAADLLGATEADTPPADAPAAAHSAMQTDAQGTEVPEDANSSSIYVQGLSEPEVCDTRADHPAREAANRLTALCEYFETYGEWPGNRSDSSDIADLRTVLARLEQLEDERDTDARAVADAIAANWRHIRGDSLTQLHEALDALEQRFADRITEQHARDGSH